MTRSEHQETRETILNAGEQLILSKGFSAVGLAQILTQANVPKGSFYHYFRSKEQFGVELLKRYFDSYNQLILALFDQPEKTGKQLLMEYWQRWFENQATICCDKQCMAVKLSAEVSDLSDDMRLILKSGIDSIIQKIATCIEQGINDGSLSAELEPHHTAFTLYQQWMGASLITKVRRDESAITNAMALTERILAK
ncbi:TetR/AcrR family transcriptional regulator [Spartinivicinus poritis]|uniref:TetR/AcrR family transcriptional regulator n=1 Tax=Spartinivicinus poritis TaxID=2994640 RepID=A0ABT5UC93_9GAMM|nr:TetR/AcrR family transcriptional regulator [Spartinivicinus sp. A2-2]MDE1464001.1 TetR/AcrR family transcriptional regulator [Spartinivicinus sp. A2-2]